MPLIDHLIELRRRLIYCIAAIVVLFFVCYWFAPHIYQFLVQPLADALAAKHEERRMIFTALHEAFFTYVKVAFFAAMFLGFPIIATQVWKFVAPGLYKHERRAFLPFLIATPLLFFAGGAMAYYVVFPMAWKFFLSFEMTGDARPADPARSQGERVPGAGDAVDLRLRPVLPDAGGDDAARPRRADHRADDAREAPLRHRHRLRLRRRADAARRDQPDQPRHPDDPSLRDLHLVRPPGRAEPGEGGARGGGEGAGGRGGGQTSAAGAGAATTGTAE